MKTNKFAIHAGHAVVGARGASSMMDEVKKNRIIKSELISYLKQHEGVTVVDTTVHSGGVYDVLRGIKQNFERKTKLKGTWLNISIHLNAASNPTANGFEIFVSPSFYKKNKDQLEKFCKAVCKETGFLNRGVKESTGLYVINNLPNCILLECGFCTSEKDKKIYDKIHSKGIACVIGEKMIKYFGRE